MSLYVSGVRYDKDRDVTIATVEFSDDINLEGISLNHLIAMELIQALADAADVDIEILGRRAK